MKITFLGDLMPGGVKTNDLSFISPEVLYYLRDSDIRVANLESPLGGDVIVFDVNTMKDEKNIIYSPEIDVNKLTYLKLDVVSLANNHIHNLGQDGLLNTIRKLDELGIKHMGAGNNLIEASEPCVVKIKDKTIAFIGCCDTDDFMGYVEVATNNHYGVNPLNIDRLTKQIKLLKQTYDFVFVIPHWGMEQRIFILNKIKTYAYKMIDAGADGIFGCHSHCVQPNIIYNDKPICFSLGNFFFPDYYQQPVLPIWYPGENDDVSNISTTTNYVIQDVYRKFIWNDFTRIGAISTIEIVGNNQIINKRFIKLSDDNIVDFFNYKSLDRKLNLIAKWIKSDTYRLIWFYLVFGRKSKHFLRRIKIIK